MFPDTSNNRTTTLDTWTLALYTGWALTVKQMTGVEEPTLTPYDINVFV